MSLKLRFRSNNAKNAVQVITHLVKYLKPVLIFVNGELPFGEKYG